MEVFISLLGMCALIGLAVLLSERRSAINPRTVLGALAFQVAFGAFVMYLPMGQTLLDAASNGVMHVINYGNEGLAFVFGDLAKFSVGFIFVINVLFVVVFISALIAVLYYLGIMQLIIGVIGGGLSKLLGTSRAESLSATANIFVGPIEAPSMVRPFVKHMTRSELFAVMTGGLASVAGGTMIGYIQMGVDIKYVLTAAFMTAPAGLLFAKLMWPETETPRNDIKKVMEEQEDKPTNVLDAAASGAAMGMQQVLAVSALLIAFVGLIAMVNGLIGGIGGWFGYAELTMQAILGYFLAPLAWLMGVPWSEATQAASFIGQKMVINEFVAYIDFLKVADDLSPKTQIIISFALCGFANLGSLAMVIGGLAALCPERRHDLSAIGMKALIAAALANLMSGTIAGLLFSLAN
ncbi:NupC/NupG family nucleoside CNT transporter [Shewanella sp. 1_MG-2023]|uniref:NupC/NupG family nucleoside CNT transporter n=1 Tax=unclassified Shewanella TaxID=196818 RepID=UPI0026E1ABD8|nr:MULTISPECIES: NupC/NupG family nucleoside CNT transporter [unclassified Shewanella]MDO6613201.1 NupC/NupG family nucleoside CNT transporter [Shewanella sp. 7_MG-2023]MDO6773127.1 NupC/NupG family nucleoside CNT transporter [Shewanella sp. 2_MG-2023]MDO6795603.1 NupC/NupG family nucleoside CNT transporter [Shewanella sp. 1_MG-2023]